MIKEEIEKAIKLLIDTAKVYYESSKESIESNKYINDQFRYATRNTFFIYEMIQKEKGNQKIYLASEKAYKDFMDRTNTYEDIREFFWGRTLKRIKLNSVYRFEHKTTVYDFKKELEKLFLKGNLTVESVKSLIEDQEFCWITKEEDEKLNHDNPKNKTRKVDAYESAGIKIKGD